MVYEKVHVNHLHTLRNNLKSDLMSRIQFLKIQLSENQTCV